MFAAINKTQKALQEYRYDAAANILDEASSVSPNHPLLLNYRAVVAARRQNPRESERYFRSIWVASPKSVQAQFNLAETLFSQRRYTEAAVFHQPASHLKKLGETAAFKRYLCLLLSDQTTEAEAFAKSLRPSIIQPMFYPVQAARSFHQGNTEAGMYFITSAQEMYGERVSPLLQPLVEIGWVDALSIR